MNRVITVKEVSNTEGMRFRASLRESTPTSIRGWGRYGDTAEEALERLQRSHNCVGVEVRYEPSKLVPIQEICGRAK